MLFSLQREGEKPKSGAFRSITMRFEIKKLLTNKMIVVLFALIMSAGFIYFGNSINAFSKKDAVPGQAEAIRLSRIEYNEKYNERSEALIRSAERIKSESSDEYTARLSDKIIAVCEKRRELPLGDNSAIMWLRVVFDDTYPALLLIFLCVLISAELLCRDRTVGKFKLNFTSKNGRLVLYKNKALALMICSACAAVVFTFVQLAAVLSGYGLTSINAPIQTETTYLNSAYNIGFSELILAAAGMRILLCWFVCFLTACLSLLFGNLIAASVGGAAFCSVLFVLFDRTLVIHGSMDIAPTKYDLHHALLKLSPVCLLDPNGYFTSRDYVNVLGFPVTELFFNIAVTALMTAALAAFGAFLSTRKRRALS